LAAIVAHTVHQRRSRSVTAITKVAFLTYISRYRSNPRPLRARRIHACGRSTPISNLYSRLFDTLIFQPKTFTAARLSAGRRLLFPSIRLGPQACRTAKAIRMTNTQAPDAAQTTSDAQAQKRHLKLLAASVRSKRASGPAPERPPLGPICRKAIGGAA
jgi:hypothetical protein